MTMVTMIPYSYSQKKKEEEEKKEPLKTPSPPSHAIQLVVA